MKHLVPAQLINAGKSRGGRKPVGTTEVFSPLNNKRVESRCCVGPQTAGCFDMCLSVSLPLYRPGPPNIPVVSSRLQLVLDFEKKNIKSGCIYIRTLCFLCVCVDEDEESAHHLHGNTPETEPSAYLNLAGIRRGDQPYRRSFGVQQSVVMASGVSDHSEAER